MYEKQLCSSSSLDVFCRGLLVVTIFLAFLEACNSVHTIDEVGWATRHGSAIWVLLGLLVICPLLSVKSVV